MTILRTQAELAEASAGDLIETLHELTGTRVARFSSLAAGRARVSNAMLAATDAANHAGVPKGTSSGVMTIGELEKKKPGAGKHLAEVSKGPETGDEDRSPPVAAIWPGTERRAVPREPAGPVEEPKIVQVHTNMNGTKNPFKRGTTEHQMWIQSNTPKDEPRPKSTPAPRGPSFSKVRPTFAGTSQPQPGSRRTKCLQIIQSRPEITMEELEREMGESCRGFVQKLLEKKHVEVVA